MFINKPNRCAKYDYNSQGIYFVTICTKNRIKHFGKIQNKIMYRSEIGQITHELWLKIPIIHENIKIDEFIIMPDHIHGVIHVDVAYYATSTHCNYATPTHCNYATPPDHPTPTQFKYKINRSKMALSKIIQSYKSIVTKTIKTQFMNYQFKWQRSFHDRIIRSETELFNVRNYIINNPVKHK